MISKNTMVVVPTQTNSEYEDNEDGTWTIIESFNQYRFTLEEALQYIVDNELRYMIEDVILYNVPLRDRLREVGMKAFVKEMKAIRPNDHTFAKYIDDFAEYYQDRKLGDFNIQLYATIDDFTILGHTFHGLKELKERVEMSCLVGISSTDDIDVVQEVKSAPHVGKFFELYPYFDSFDSLYDSRTYQNYIIRQEPISKEEMKNVLDECSVWDIQFIHGFMSTEFLPMVYYEGDGGYILVATKKTPQKEDV